MSWLTVAGCAVAVPAYAASQWLANWFVFRSRGPCKCCCCTGKCGNGAFDRCGRCDREVM